MLQKQNQSSCKFHFRSNTLSLNKSFDIHMLYTLHFLKALFVYLGYTYSITYHKPPKNLGL